MDEGTGAESRYEHSHAPTGNAVLPTALRLAADERYTGKGVTIAFLDSGFTPHPDLTLPESRIAAYADITGDGAPLAPDGPPEGWRWHGTQTSVSAAGNGRLSDGYYAGLARNARVVLGKVSRAGKIAEEDIAAGIRWVLERKDELGIRVVSISLGGDVDVPYETNVVDRAAEDAIAKGLVVVVAAGNSGLADDPRTVPPGNSPSVVTVGGYDDGNTLYTAPKDLYHSNYGPTADGVLKPEIIAPAQWVAAPILLGTPSEEKALALCELAEAEDFQYLKRAERLALVAGLDPALLSTSSREIRKAVAKLLRQSKTVAAHYQHVDGTSFAAPVVASVVAQMLEANPRLTPAAVKHLLISTADRLPGASAVRQGYGVVNAKRAVEEATHEHHVLGDLVGLAASARPS